MAKDKQDFPRGGDIPVGRTKEGYTTIHTIVIRDGGVYDVWFPKEGEPVIIREHEYNPFVFLDDAVKWCVLEERYANPA